MTGDPSHPLFLLWISKGDLTRIVYANFHGILIVGYFFNEIKWILSYRCQWQPVEYPNVPLKDALLSYVFTPYLIKKFRRTHPFEKFD